MSAFAFLRTAAATALAARTFTPAGRVNLHLDPSVPNEAATIDEVTRWASLPVRHGRFRRSGPMGTGCVIFEFEQLRDAMECFLLYG